MEIGAGLLMPDGPASTTDAGPFQGLGEDVAERSEDHVVQSFRRSGRSSYRCNARPGLPCDVRVLRAELEPASGAAVEAVPEAEGSLDQSASVGRAIGETSGSETGIYGGR